MHRARQDIHVRGDLYVEERRAEAPPGGQKLKIASFGEKKKNLKNLFIFTYAFWIIPRQLLISFLTRLVLNTVVRFCREFYLIAFS